MHTCKHTNTHARVHTRARMSRGLMSFACLSPLPRTGKLRWCVLKDGNIYYFKTPSDEVQRGQFSLSRLSIKQVSTESRPWAFQVGVLVCVCVCVCVRVYACLFSSLLFSSLLFSSLLCLGWHAVPVLTQLSARFSTARAPNVKGPRLGACCSE